MAPKVNPETQPIPLVGLKPTAFSEAPPVRRPVTGPPALAGFPDGTKGNQLGAKPAVGKNNG